MPNHIKNRLEFIGSISDIDALLKKFGTYVPASISRTHDGQEIICKKKGEQFGFCWFNDKTGLSFNRDGITNHNGIPEGYEIEVYDSKFAFPDFDRVIPHPETDAYNDKPSQDAVRNDPTWWYNWNPVNWGTKWNSYSHEKEAINIYTFETAWSPVHKIINVISIAFPEVIIKYSWADEDTGSNCGRSVYKNGLQEVTEPESRSNEAYEVAFELRPECAEHYEVVNGQYRYKED